MQAIVNVSPDWGIGSNNELLVRIRADMKRFRALTTRNTIIVGRKTLLTFPNQKPLPNRENVVLTRDASFTVDGAVICRDLDELRILLKEREPDSVYVCGGESVYRLLLPYCTKALVTVTYTNKQADRFFPDLDRAQNWILSEVGPMETEGDLKYRFLEYLNTETKKL